MARSPKEFNAAYEWLTDLLRDHSWVSYEIICKEARERGTSWRTLHRAKAALNILSNSNNCSGKSQGYWKLPKHYRTAKGRAKEKAARQAIRERNALSALVRATNRYKKVIAQGKTLRLSAASRLLLP
jgi:hypothetical protein